MNKLEDTTNLSRKDTKMFTLAHTNMHTHKSKHTDANTHTVHHAHTLARTQEQSKLRIASPQK